MTRDHDAIGARRIPTKLSAASLRRFEQLHRWRQAAAWAPMIWLPLMIYGLSTQRLALAMALGLSGFLFAVLARAVVWSRRCPECGEHFGASSSSFDEVWEASGCRACGVTLFQLRRREPVRAPARGMAARLRRHPRTI